MVELVAIVQQLRWHAAHPTAEPFGNVLLAHAGIYVGALVAAIGAALFLRDARWRLAAALVGGGAALRFGAAVTDMGAHVRGWDAMPFHHAYRAGIALGFVGALVGAAIVAQRARASTGASA